MRFGRGELEHRAEIYLDAYLMILESFSLTRNCDDDDRILFAMWAKLANTYNPVYHSGLDAEKDIEITEYNATLGKLEIKNAMRM